MVPIRRLHPQGSPAGTRGRCRRPACSSTRMDSCTQAGHTAHPPALAPGAHILDSDGRSIFPAIDLAPASLADVVVPVIDAVADRLHLAQARDRNRLDSVGAGEGVGTRNGHSIVIGTRPGSLHLHPRRARGLASRLASRLRESAPAGQRPALELGVFGAEARLGKLGFIGAAEREASARPTTRRHQPRASGERESTSLSILDPMIGIAARHPGKSADHRDEVNGVSVQKPIVWCRDWLPVWAG